MGVGWEKKTRGKMVVVDQIDVPCSPAFSLNQLLARCFQEAYKAGHEYNSPLFSFF